MTENVDDNQDSFKKLLHGLLDGQLTEAQLRQLEQRIQTSPSAMKMYMETVTLSVGLRRFSQTQRGAMQEVIQQAPDQSALWQTLAIDEKQAPTIKVPKRKKWFKFKAKPIVIQPKETNIQRVHRHISRYPLSLLITASAALILLLAYIRLFPTQSLATLNDSIDAVWNNHANEFREGKGWYPDNGQQTLKEGFAQVRFGCGAEVIFEAPSQFELESKDQLFLKQGKIFVKVPKEAIGFSVRTPNSRIIDLGTEFGVTVEEDGTSQFQMFSGKASLIAGAAGQEKISELLLAGQAFAVDAQTGKISLAAFVDGKFVQRIDSSRQIVWRGEKSVNLVDFIAGGNGLGTDRQGYLNPITGIITAELNELTPVDKKYPPLTYKTVTDSRYIDGIFVPHGNNSPTQVSSQGHEFLFAENSAEIWYPAMTATYYVTADNEGSQSPGEGATPRPAFYLHANLGVTFDLDMIRKDYPGMKITGFRMQYGVRFIEDGRLRNTNFDLWVLVDGQKRDERLGKIYERQVEDTYIALNDTDRFLTLATTDADKKIGDDWGVFINPIIEFASE